MDIKHFNLTACNRLLQLRRDRRISWRAFALGMVIASFVDKDTGEAWPSRTTLSAITGIKKMDISSVVRELRVADFFTIEERDGRSNIYHMTHPHLATGSNSVPIPEQRPTHPLLASKPIPEQRPITIKEQYSNNDLSQNNEEPPSRSASSKADNPVEPEGTTKPPKLELIPLSAENKTAASEPKQKAKKAPRPKITVGTGTAERVVSKYSEIVKPKKLDNSGGSKKFIETANRLLSEGVTEQDMVQAMRNYLAVRIAQERKKKNPEDQIEFRFGFQTFFGPKEAHWRDYLNIEVSDTGQPDRHSTDALEQMRYAISLAKNPTKEPSKEERKLEHTYAAI